MATALGERDWQDMGTIIINGRRFDGNDVAIRDGKVVIDGKPQAGELRGGVDLHVADSVDGQAQCVASVTCGDARGGAIQVVAFASAGAGRRDKKPT